MDKLPFYYLLLLAPVLYPVDNAITGITAEFILMLLLGIGYMVYCRHKRFRWNVLDVLFVLFVAWYTARLSWSEPPLNTRGICSGLCCLLLYFYARTVSFSSVVFPLLLCAGVVQSAWCWAQWFHLLPSSHPFFGATGGFFNPALASVALAASCVAGVCVATTGSRPVFRVLAWAACAAMFATLVRLGSRASWVGLVAGMGWLLFSSGKLATRRKWDALLVLLLIPAVAGLLYWLNPVSVQGRFLIWQVSKDIFGDSPWVGSGSFASSYMPAQAEWFAARPDSPYVRVAGNNGYAFNEFVRVACETGVLGLLLFVGLLVLGLREAWKGGKDSRYAGAVLATILVFGLFGYPFSSGLVVAVAVLAVATIAKEAAPGVVRVAQYSPYNFIRQTALVLCLFAFSFEYYRLKRADVLLAKAQKDVAETVDYRLARYYNHLSNTPDFVLAYGRAIYLRGSYLQALPVLERACELRPMYTIVCDLGSCYQRLSLWRQAEQRYRLAADMVPGYIVPRSLLFNLYKEIGDYEKAEPVARGILDKPVKVVNSTVLRTRHAARKFLETMEQTKR